MRIIINRDLYKDEENEAVMRLEFLCEYTPGTDDHFCNGHGNWLPGDAPECKIVSVRVNEAAPNKEVREFLCSLFQDEVKAEVLALPKDAS